MELLRFECLDNVLEAVLFSAASFFWQSKSNQILNARATILTETPKTFDRTEVNIVTGIDFTLRYVLFMYAFKYTVVVMSTSTKLFDIFC